MKQRFVAITSILVLLLSLAACTRNSDKTEIANLNEAKVSVSLPASFFADHPPEEVIAAYAEEKGITASVNEDGSYTLTMFKAQHDEQMSEMRQGIKESFSEMAADETGIIKEIKHNDHFSDITIVVNRADYENDFLAAVSVGTAVFVCGLQGWMYNLFNGTKDPKITINIQDANSGKIIHSTIYPDGYA